LLSHFKELTVILAHMAPGTVLTANPTKGRPASPIQKGMIGK